MYPECQREREGGMTQRHIKIIIARVYRHAYTIPYHIIPYILYVDNYQLCLN